MSFPDPTTYPIVFLPKEKETIFLAIKEFPVSFAFDAHPRQAIMNSMVVEQLQTFFMSQDIYKDENVAIFDKNVGSNIELLATDRDITKTDFSLKFYINRNEFKAIKSGQLQIVNQPTGIGVNIEHLFIMASNTFTFNAYNDDGDYYYPTASLKLIFYPYIKNTSYVWTDITLPDKQSTPIVIAPVDCYGLLDVLAEVKIKWYLDQERILPTPYAPFTIDDFKFGIRFCISNKGSLFKNAVQLGLAGSSQGTAVATSLYSTNTLHDFDQNVFHKIFYWGSGELNTDLFYGKVDKIEVADNGLPIQLGSEVAVYILDNLLPDIHFSSSSSSSISSSSVSSISSSSVSSLSSLNSSISSSLSSYSSISSETSMSSVTSSSSLSSLEVTSSSSQSPSTATSESSSSTGIIALSSSSSLSSSTQIKTWSSSSSSIEERVVLYYGFANEYNTFKEVIDESGNGHTATMGGTPPIATWSDVGGIHGGRYIFSPSGSHIQYITSLNMTGFESLNKGTISIWAKLSDVSLLTSSSLFAITNEALVEDKTELIIGFSIGAIKEIIASVSVDGEVKWTLNAELTTTFVGNWYNFVLVQDGISPALYINGLLYPFTFSVSDYKSFWINSLFSYSTISKPQQMMLATTLRNYFPYKVLGFSGEMDEIKMWNTNLSEDAIYQEYLKIRGTT